MMALRTCYGLSKFSLIFFIAVLLMAPPSPSTRSSTAALPTSKNTSRSSSGQIGQGAEARRGHQDAEPHRLHDDRRHRRRVRLFHAEVRLGGAGQGDGLCRGHRAGHAEVQRGNESSTSTRRTTRSSSWRKRTTPPPTQQRGPRLLCNAYHHLEKRADYFTRVKASLKPKGRVAIIDFYHDERSGNLGFSKDHLVPRDTVIKEMTDAGYTLSKSTPSCPSNTSWNSSSLASNRNTHGR